MELTGDRHIPAPQQTVWNALNDAEVLKACIPGCEEIAWTSDNTLEASVKAKVGPVKATFKGSVELSDANPPHSYVISGQGKGGAAGFAKGSATVKLSPEDGGTLLSYEVSASVGGKLAQVGGRLIQGTAKKLADEFFDAITSELGGDTSAPTEDESGNSVTNEDANDVRLPPLVWATGLAALLALSLWFYY